MFLRACAKALRSVASTSKSTLHPSNPLQEPARRTVDQHLCSQTFFAEALRSWRSASKLAVQQSSSIPRTAAGHTGWLQQTTRSHHKGIWSQVCWKQVKSDTAASRPRQTRSFSGLKGRSSAESWLKRHCSTAAALPRATAGNLAAQASTLAGDVPPGVRRQLGWWLAGCAGWTASMVVLGGMTRLTRSGLSMTDWKFTGERPPRTPDDWEAEFAKYRASPEFQRVNRGMSLAEFKFIYWMEYAHRMWGRLLGVAFAVPAAYFAARGQISGPLARRLGLLFLMGGGQGLVGWWMVRSGLEEPAQEWDTPRVSPYRLAAHLASAFTIYSLLLWTSLSLLLPQPATVGLPEAAARACAVLRARVHPLAALVGLTAISGAFVAGLDAGHAYNTFPTMNGAWVPEEYWAVPGWRNAFESTAAVQLHHRVLAATTLASVAGLWAAQRSAPLPRPARLLLNALAVVTAAQVTLGISTLLLHVPASLGSAHQAGALTLFSLLLALMHRLRPAVGALSRAAPTKAWVAPAVAAAAVSAVAAGTAA